MQISVEVRGGTLQDVESAAVIEHGVLEVVDGEGRRHLMSPHYWHEVVMVEDEPR